METNFSGQPNPEDVEANPADEIREAQNSTADHLEAQPEHRRRKHHEDHHVNRKFRLFSNHSSYGDSPHTNTSI